MSKFPVVCKDTREVPRTYKEYLKTKHWLKKKAEYGKTHKQNCVMCQDTKNLQLHHMKYDNLGNEKLEDLAYLCGNCHGNLHIGLKETHTDVKKIIIFNNFVEKIDKETNKKRVQKQMKFYIINDTKVYANKNYKGIFYSIKLKTGEKIVVTNWETCKKYTQNKSGVLFKNFLI